MDWERKQEIQNGNPQSMWENMQAPHEAQIKPPTQDVKGKHAKL